MSAAPDLFTSPFTAIEEPTRRSLRTVADLSRGQHGRIQEVVGHDAVGHRLMEMGMVRGADVKLIRVAPLGDPLELEVRGYRLSIRRDEARRFLIEEAPAFAALPAQSL